MRDYSCGKRPSRLRVAVAALVVLLAALPACSDDGTQGTQDSGSPDSGVDVRLDDGPPDSTAEAGTFCAPRMPDGAVGQDGACPVALPKQKDKLDEALSKLKLDRCTAVFSQADKKIFGSNYDIIWGDPFRLPWFDTVHSAALNGPPFARLLVAQADTAMAGKHPVTSSLAVAAHYAGYGAKVCLAPVPVAAKDPLATALGALITGAGGKADAAALRKQAAAVPLDLQRALVPVIAALGDAARARELALKDADLGKTATSPGVDLPTLYRYAASINIMPYKSGKKMAPTQQWVRNLVAGKAKGFKYGTLYAAAVKLAAAVENARLTRFAGKQITLNVETPLGRVILAGPANHTYDPTDAKIGSAVALLLETGGDDVYRIPAGATASAKYPVSVLVDLGGEDSYGYQEVPSSYDGKRLVSDADGRQAGQAGSTTAPVSLSETSRQGAARLGIGLLFDLGTDDDRYTSLRMSQGFGALGVGVLYDAGGDDVYKGENGVQGAAVHGIGLLLDAGGDDYYGTYHQSQGYAYVKGVGFLYDTAGADEYFADPGDPKQGGDPLYYSPQLPGKGNSSFTQGAGFGRRAAGTAADPYFMSGGLGLLRDRAGNDKYTTSVFGQGTGYWFGTGILADAAGDDSYDGLWYVQGSDAHFALAVFWDQAGNDKYNAKLVPRATSIGVGHDFSVGWHLDLAGNDSYRAPGLSLGSGNDNGIGIMINLGGNDSYDTQGKRTLGGASIGATAAAGARASVINLGVFVDTGGTDSYTISGKADDRNDKSWLYSSTNTGTTKEWGVGLDGKGTVSLP